MQNHIKFGTDGWRAIIAKEFTTQNVARAAQGHANWLKANFETPTVIIGHDCRFAGELFAETVAKVMLSNDITVFISKGFVSTPMLSLGCLTYQAHGGVMITASHNPPLYNGYKLKSKEGGPLLEHLVKEVEALIPNSIESDWDSVNLQTCEKDGKLKIVDLETDYINRVKTSFDLQAIQFSGLNFAYDAMYGAGQNVMRKLFEDITFVHCEHNPLFDGIPPEPILKNLHEFSEIIRISEDIDCGLVTDGDADRIGLFDNTGHFVDSHHVLLLLTYYLYIHKGWRGKVVTGFSTTVKLEKLCQHFQLPFEVVPIGFKHVSGIMLREDVLVGGEESGGIAVKGHIPERDGIWNGMLIWEMLVKTGKSLKQLVQEVYDLVGPFAFVREDLEVPETIKQQILNQCKNGAYTSFGSFVIQRTETLDGFKYYISENSWVMIRPSGTEPVLRIYAESDNNEKANLLLQAAKTTIGL